MKPLGLLFCLCAFILSVQAETDYEITVAPDGSGDFKSIQAAIDATKAFPDRRITLHIKNGIYHEPVRVYEWNPRLSLIGESAEKTIIRWGSHFQQVNRGRNSTFHTATLSVEGNDFHGENLTIENTAGPVGQALALSVNADRVSFNNSRFLGHQDTIYVTGEGKRQYFKNCYVEGTTDFIFGQGTAVFDQCEIHAKADSYITAASTPDTRQYGLVFLRATLTAEEGVSKVYLGRPWRAHAKTVFIDSWLGAHIRPEGWHNWSKPAAEHTSFYAEYNSRGPGAADSAQRAPWTHTLTKEQATEYTVETILGSKTHPEWYRR